MVDEPSPATLVVTALEDLRRTADAASEDLLAAYPVLGDLTAQRAVDQSVDAAADLLRSVAAQAADIATRVGAARPTSRADSTVSISPTGSARGGIGTGPRTTRLGGRR